MKKETLNLNLGIETTDREVDEIISAFPPSIELKYEKNIRRLSFSPDSLPLIISFSMGAIASGLFYDALKLALKKLLKKFNDKTSNKKLLIKITTTSNTYIISKDKIILQSVEKEILYSTIDELIDEIKEVK